MSSTAEIILWGTRIGAVRLPDDSDYADFEYDPDFIRSGIQIAPLTMPLGRRVYRFPELALTTFHGLPGLLADALPDKFGNAVINAWLATQGRTSESFNAIERLCYTGARAMGALEFRPTNGPRQRSSKPIDIDALVGLASEVLRNRQDLNQSFAAPKRQQALQQILSVGTSAGGARAKAVIAWNSTTNEVRSGQVEAGEGFGYWLLKFDGVSGNRDKELEDPQGFGAIEYAYYLMAKAAGITMTECRLLEDGRRRHFMTKRFDRTDAGAKLHMQSLCAMAHYDFNMAGAYSYEQAMLVMRQLNLGMEAIEEQFRRMAFNIVARNQDDHVKNIAFLMDKSGQWTLSPAYDVNYAYNPTGEWTSRHQMSMNGKLDGFALEDFKAAGSVCSMKRGRPETILAEVIEAVKRWPEFAAEAGVSTKAADAIAPTHRIQL
ncbi:MULTISPECIES: type II toxin-antitoxin system HipA family toxin [Asticcacaulis]|uniref:type II toxin-antitoxin system HipA family toxin n=1 Tax=Asticcacaulis TaxID=76890 RepID=UPI001AE3EC88|nr:MULTISPECIES: HipA domain-containing protein [Asticcacaulis]MBP2160488.1 serine/threonine-protein kinase HipA [Asticcacaulis solisilvae]MDR6801533.1 serine/threonine-protein kinase HipA [Asticcacaulis sp. BE141]